jgi:hypothetical protein
LRAWWLPVTLVVCFLRQYLLEFSDDPAALKYFNTHTDDAEKRRHSWNSLRRRLKRRCEKALAGFKPMITSIDFSQLPSDSDSWEESAADFVLEWPSTHPPSEV